MTAGVLPPRALDPAPISILTQRWRSIRPFAALGSLSIVAGGFVAAVTRPTGFEMGSWLAAFLVLVGGVAQIALGGGQAWLTDRQPSANTLIAELTIWNVGLALTIAGSLASIPAVTTIGSLAVVAALALFLRVVRNGPYRLRRPRLVYQLLLWFVLISTPVGIVLAWIRHG